jgi:hypothetical protein
VRNKRGSTLQPVPRNTHDDDDATLRSRRVSELERCGALGHRLSSPEKSRHYGPMDHKPTRHARLLQSIDIAGTFVLAIQGASIAAVKGLDAFGIVVVSLATATGGGIMRDLLIGESPPEALRWLANRHIGPSGRVHDVFRVSHGRGDSGIRPDRRGRPRSGAGPKRRWNSG